MSYAMLPAALVLAAAERYLAKRETLLKGWETESVERRIQDSKPNFLTKFFGAKQLTREEAVAEYRESSQRQFHRVHGGHWAREAKGVLALARQAVASDSQTVALSSDLAHTFDAAGVFNQE